MRRGRFDADDLARTVEVARACRRGGTFEERMAGIASALRPLVPFTQLTTAMIHFDSLRPQEPGKTYALGIDPHAFDSYTTYYHQLDPSIPALRARPGVSMLSSQFVSDRDFGRTEYTRDCLEPLEIRWICGTLSEMPDGWSMVYSIERDRLRPDFSSRDLEVVRAVIPEIERAAFGALLEDKLARLGTTPPADGLADRADGGIAELSRTGDVVRASPLALGVLRRARPEDVIEVVRAAFAGQGPGTGPGWTDARALRLVDGEVAHLIFAFAGASADRALVQLETARPSRANPALALLTRREREVADLVAAGLANKEIAARLRISAETVKSHVSLACRKTGCDGRTALAVLVARGLGAQ